jgi:hypothetical protein
MDRFTNILRHIVFFLFPIPFLLGFAIEQGDDWPGLLAYLAAGVLFAVAIGVAWTVFRRGP